MKLLTGADIGLMLLIAAGLPWLYWHYWRTEPGQWLQIQVQRQAPQRTPLSQQEIRIRGPLGETLIEVDTGRARFVASPCHNKVCIQRGWIQQAGEVAACLPNQISLQILGADAPYDAINF